MRIAIEIIRGVALAVAIIPEVIKTVMGNMRKNNEIR